MKILQKDADPPYFLPGLQQPPISYGEVCALWTQLQWILEFARITSFEVAVRQEH